MNRQTIANRSGDLPQIENALSQYSAAMVYAARSAGLVGHDIEDFVQDFRVRMMSGELDEKIKSLKPTEFVGKIVGMARNFRMRKLRRDVRTEINYERVVSVVDPRQCASEAIECKESLEAAIQKLNPRYQLAIRVWCRSVSYEAVADDQGISFGAAKVLVSRARSALAKVYFEDKTD